MTKHEVIIQHPRYKNAITTGWIEYEGHKPLWHLIGLHDHSHVFMV